MGAELSEEARRSGAGPRRLTVGRVDAEVDGHRRDALVSASDPVGLSLDLQAHLLEVGEFLPLAVQELGIFCPRMGWGEERWRGKHLNLDPTWVPSSTGNGPTHSPKHCLLSLPSPQQSHVSVLHFYPHCPVGESRAKVIEEASAVARPDLSLGIEWGGWRGRSDCWRTRAHTCGGIDQLQDQGASGDNA